MNQPPLDQSSSRVRRTRLIPGLSPGLVLSLLLTAAAPAGAATIVWSGASGADTNWSNGNNWIGAVAPAGGDDVKFFDPGTNLTVGLPNNLVDGGFAGYISSLQYGNSNGFHTTVIAAGQTLNVTNTGGLWMFSPGEPATAKTLTNSITGAGGTLNVSNAAAVISLNQGGAVAGNRANLNMSGLDNFLASVSRIGLGSSTFPSTTTANTRYGGQLILARTNIIALSYADTLANYQLSGRSNAIELARAPGNNAGIICLLLLGQSNALYLDSIGCGMDKSGNNSTAASGVMAFNPVFANSTAYFRGKNGGATDRVTWWSVGDANASSSSSNGGRGTNDFSNGTIDALINVLSLGRECNALNTGFAGPHSGVFTFTAGTVDVNTIYAGNEAFNQPGSMPGCAGTLNVNGATALLKVNSLLKLGNTTVTYAPAPGGSGTNAFRTSGTLTVRNGGTVWANSISVGAASVTNTINLFDSTLLVTNTLPTNAAGLFTFNISNSTLGLTISTNGLMRGLVQTLNSTGPTNIIQLDSAPVVFSTYPQQIPLIKYTTWNGSNVFGLASVPAWAPGALLVSNSVNKSLDLSLPTDPRPVFTSTPAGYSGTPGDNIVGKLAVSIAAGSVQPLTCQWYYYPTVGSATNPVSDGTAASGAIYTGGATASLSITNAQIADSGNYFIVVSNVYGRLTSGVVVVAISPGCTAPFITGPVDQTVIQGGSATFSASVTANPAAALQWQRNGVNLQDETNLTYTLFGAQYPADDQAVFSLIATNDCGNVTNRATLTVTVPPAISVEPVNQVVTNTQAAAFSVTAAGVPSPGYQWYKGSQPITGATGPMLSFANADPTNIGSYYCTVFNSAGATNTTTNTLIVNSTMAATVLAPANGATGVCYDAPLYVTFNATPQLKGAGKIRVYNLTNSATPSDTLDMTLGMAQARAIGGDVFNSYPVIITGNTAAIYPHAGVMTSNQTYYVLIDDGVFADTNGAYFAGVAATNGWQFSTKPAGPANPTNLVVAADGSGDFATVQGAVDAVPGNNVTPTLINIRNGIYTGIVDVKSKNNLTFRGQSRNGAIIAYPNNNNLNSTGAPLRAMVVLNGNDCAFENITLTNSTPKGGSQAEALDVEGTRCILYNLELDSFQDTFLVHSAGKLVYFQDCLVQGDTDFNWGYGTVFYTNCELRCLSTGSHVTQPRSPLGSNGFSFVNCQITKGSGVTSSDLGRSISTPSTPSEAIFIRCLMDDVITGYSSDAGTNFWYASCSNLTATVEKTSLTYATRLASTDPIVLLAQNANSWLYGWAPQMAPNLLTNPVGTSVAGGQPVMLSAFATGIPAPSYQWFKDGNPLAGQTGPTLTLLNAYAGDAGAYSVIVSNAAGMVVSSSAVVSVGNTAPALGAIADLTVNAGAPVSLSDAATDPDQPTQTLAYSLLTGPANAAVNAAGQVTWRPLVSQADSTNRFTVVVADNGSPSLSATNSFSVIVNPLSRPSFAAPTFAGGKISLNLAGPIGPDYTVLVSTNLVNWDILTTLSSPATPFTWTDDGSATNAMRFYRLQLGP